MLTIYDTANEIRFQTPINKGSKRAVELMGNDYVMLKFSVSRPIYFKLGDWCDIPGFGRFELVELYHPTYNKATGGYDYELELEAYYCKWRNKIFKYTPESSGREASWSLTATLDVHLGVFLRNLKALGYTYNEQEFIFSIDETVVQSAKPLTYNNTDMISALNMMAEAWECEWWIEDHVIYFGRCELGTPIDFEQGVNVEDISSSGNKNVYATRIYAFGSTRNIPVNYRPVDESVVVNGIVQKRLMLPAGTPYVDAYPDMPTEAAVEQVVVFDDIYPRTDGKIDSVDSYTNTVTNEDGTTNTETFYRFKDNSIKFSKDYILENEELHIIFQSGSLNGLDFGVTFNPLGVSEKLSDGSWNPDAQLWEIVANENYGRKLPDTVLVPKAGDKYVLYGWDATKIADLGLIAKAEQELLAKTNEYIAKTKIDPNSYPCTMMSDWMKEQGQTSTGYYFPFRLGDRVNLISDAHFINGCRQSRIIGYECPLDYPYDSPVITVGETKTVSRLGALENTVESLTLKGQTFTGVGNEGGNSVYLITTNDSTTPTNRNVFSALRSLQEFLSKKNDDTAAGLITFLKGLTARAVARLKEGAEFGEFISGMMTGIGGAVDGRGNAEFESVTVRSALRVMELIINRLGAQEGDTIYSESDTIDSCTLNPDGTYTLKVKEKYDGYFTAMTAGMVLKGTVNTLGKGGTDYYTSFMRVNSVNASANILEVSLYPDDEVPAGKNYPPCPLMKAVRWGHQTDRSKQSLFYVSSTEGRLVKLTGVDRPIIGFWNYEVSFGTLPEKLSELLPIALGESGLYAKHIVAESIWQLDHQGRPLPTVRDRGPYAPDGDYYSGDTLRPETNDWELSDTWHNGCRWRCMVTGTDVPPSYDVTAWAFIEGDPTFRVELRGGPAAIRPRSFRFTLEVAASIYNEDITHTIADGDIEWTRYTEDSDGNPRTDSDNIWAMRHAQAGKSLTLTEADLDIIAGIVPKVAVFTATVRLRPGTTPVKASYGYRT